MPRLPLLWRTLRVDFPVFITVALPVVVLGLGLALALFGQIPGIHGRKGLQADDLVYLLVFGAFLIAICEPLLLLRLRYLHRLLTSGQEACGFILRCNRARNGSRIRFSYRFGARRYERSLRTPTWIDEFEPQRRITVIVDPWRPRRALIKQLYF